MSVYKEDWDLVVQPPVPKLMEHKSLSPNIHWSTRFKLLRMESPTRSLVSMVLTNMKVPLFLEVSYSTLCSKVTLSVCLLRF